MKRTETIHCKEMTEKMSPLTLKTLRLKLEKAKPFHSLCKPDLLGRADTKDAAQMRAPKSKEAYSELYVYHSHQITDT